MISADRSASPERVAGSTRLSAGRRWLTHPLVQAGLAIGVAGAGRIALNSVVSLRFGTAVFGQYAATVSAVILVGSLASAGPAAATTLGVARRWGEGAGELPAALLRFLLTILLLFLFVGVVSGLVYPPLRGAMAPAVWGIAVASYAGYQVGRAFGYAVQAAAAVTRAEVVGACLALGAVIALALGGVQRPLPQLWLVFVLGPVAFLIAFWVQVRNRVRAGPGALTREERRASLRESFVFFVGAGSSMTMQYLPVIIAGRLQETTTAAILFGAVQATAPLLLLSRIYGAVMMPAFAGAADDSASQGHLRLIQPFFLPSLAVALGLAPWVVVSLGVAPSDAALSVGGLVALMTLMQVWATPAVTILSARKRELIPALASLGGLAVASLIWVLSVRTGVVLLLPVGLAVGAVVRSLVPMWVISGARLGRFDRARLAGLASGVAVALSLLALSWAPTAIALGGGAFLVLIGLALGYRAWPRAADSVDAHPAR